MEIILAVVVVGAVLFFGALISAGNERQRRAIDDLREEATLWAIQDLQIKREQLAREVQVADPLGWLNRIAAEACGYDLDLQVVESLENPRALVCSSGSGSSMVIFSPTAPGEIRKMKRARSGRLSRYPKQSPLLSLPDKVSSYSISALTGSLLFDLELPLAWKALTNQNLDRIQRLWMYVL